MPFQIVLVTYKNRLPSRFEIRVSFWNGYIYRIRDGDYRIVYSIKDTALMVLVVKIGHRRDIYH